MQGFYFLAMLLGVAWLCVWSVLPPAWRDQGWWPFDMRDDDAPGPEPTGRDGTPPRRPGWRDAARAPAGPAPARPERARDEPVAAARWRR